MSRLAKKPIVIPANTEVTFSDKTLVVKGPLGTLTKTLSAHINLDIDTANKVINISASDKLENKALLGTSASHLKNMIAGVNKPYEKKLVIEGIGYKAEVKGTDVVFALGFSHPIKLAIPSDLKITSDKGVVTISGIDKDKVGEYTAGIRALKKPEPYKGKGIRYSDEVVRRKQGKKAA
jgi:large subunit ribosomal protein L6